MEVALAILTKGTGNILTMVRRLMLMRGGKSAFEINNMFREAKNEAKSAGKLLACSLAIRGIKPI